MCFSDFCLCCLRWAARSLTLQHVGQVGEVHLLKWYASISRTCLGSKLSNVSYKAERTRSRVSSCWSVSSSWACSNRTPIVAGTSIVLEPLTSVLNDHWQPTKASGGGRSGDKQSGTARANPLRFLKKTCLAPIEIRVPCNLTTTCDRRYVDPISAFSTAFVR